MTGYGRATAALAGSTLTIQVSSVNRKTLDLTVSLPEEWERLEEDVRAWALERGDLLVYVGPVVGARPKQMGAVSVPAAFFKIVVDRKSGETLAFEMPQKGIAKGDVTPWLTTVAAIEQETGLKFGLKVAGKTPWPADLAGWHKAHKAACGKQGSGPE